MKLNFRHRRIEFAFIGVLSLALTGCATGNRAARRPESARDVADLRAMVDDSLKSVQAAMASLQALGGARGTYPPEVLARFANDVERVQIDSMRFRSHARAMQTRGDAYFYEWQRHLASGSDPAAVQLSQEHEQFVPRRFADIQQRSRRAGEALGGFLSDLRALRRTLENNPAASAAGETKDLVRQTEESGHDAQQALESLAQRLDTDANLPPRTRTVKE